jgi:hypothetical protein
MKGIKTIAIAMMLLGSLLLMQGVAVAVDGLYEGCCMTGGGMLWGCSPTNRCVIVNYGLLLTCPGPVVLPVDEFAPTDSAQVEGSMDANLLSVLWKGNRFIMTHLDKSSCDGYSNALGRKLPSNLYFGFNTFWGNGTGLLNGQPGCTIEFKFVDGRTLGTRDQAHIEITCPSGDVLDAEGYIVWGGQATHCPMLF